MFYIFLWLRYEDFVVASWSIPWLFIDSLAIVFQRLDIPTIYKVCDICFTWMLHKIWWGGRVTSKMRFTNNRLTGLRADNTSFGSTKLCRFQLKKIMIFLRIHKFQVCYQGHTCLVAIFWANFLWISCLEGFAVGGHTFWCCTTLLLWVSLNLQTYWINGLTVPTTTIHEFPVNRLYECKPVKTFKEDDE